MAKIVLSRDGEIVDQRFITEARLTIGRGSDNVLVIDDADVRPFHAMIVPMVNDHFIESSDPEAMLQVNGQKAGRHLLQHGDVIFLGGHRLKYINAASSRVGFDLTQAIGTPGMQAQIGAVHSIQNEMPVLPDENSPNVASAVARNTRARFPRGVLVRQGGGGQRIRIEHALIGLDQTEAGAAAVIVRRPQGCYLLASGGVRAVTVKHNGQLIGRQAVLLSDGDLVDLGNQVFQFEYEK